MKRVLFFSLTCLLFVSLANKACQAECKAVCGNGSMMNKIAFELGSFGQKIENVTVPVVGKLGNVLPIAVVAFCLQKFPEQTIALLTCCLAYGLYCNEKVCEVVRGCANMKLLRNKKTVENTPREDQFDDDFFAFNDEDELDIEDEEDDLLDESFDCDFKKTPVITKKSLSFL
jgi:hypothetical protein